MYLINLIRSIAHNLNTLDGAIINQVFAILHFQWLLFHFLLNYKWMCNIHLGPTKKTEKTNINIYYYVIYKITYNN